MYSLQSQKLDCRIYAVVISFFRFVTILLRARHYNWCPTRVPYTLHISPILVRADTKRPFRTMSFACRLLKSGVFILRSCAERWLTSSPKRTTRVNFTMSSTIRNQSSCAVFSLSPIKSHTLLNYRSENSETTIGVGFRFLYLLCCLFVSQSLS